MTNDKAGRIAVLGLGRMGSAIARCLSTQGYGPIVWNRSAEKAASFDRCADSAVTAIEQASLVFISVTDYASTFAVLEPCATLNLEGRTIMQMSSGTPNEARALDAWVRERGGTYLDAAIVSYPHAIGGPQTLIFIAGPQATYDESSDIFRTLGGNSQYVGIAIGAAATLDCAILQYMYGANLAALQGAAICASEDFPT